MVEFEDNLVLRDRKNNNYNVGAITAVLTISGFFCMLNETVLNMALKSIMSQFGITAITAQWLSTGYMLIMGISIPISAFLIQSYKTRQLYIASMIIFILGTIISGLAPAFPILLAGRLIQAVGTGILIPNIVNTLIIINPEEKRGRALGIFNLVMFFAPAIGPVLSGLIIQNLSWRWLFFSILPFTIIALILGSMFVANVTDISKPKVDVVSIILSTVGFGCIIYGASNIGNSAVYLMVIPFIISGISLAGFVVRQLRLKEPLLDMNAFRYPMFSIGTVLIIIMHMVNFAIMLMLPMFMEGAMGLSAFTAGLIMLPGGIINGIIAPLAGSLYDKHGPKVLIFPGFLISTAVFIIFSRAISVKISIALIIILHCISLIAVGMINTPTQTNSLNQLTPKLYPHGTAITNTLQQIGGAFGTSLFVAIMSAGQKNYLNNIANGHGAANQANALAYGVRLSLTVAVGILIVAVVLSFFLKRNTESVRTEN
ncbi:MDR family MFS transporter [Clostridium oryzae]|uniref:Putative multidrug resistance protein EmrY n=1 Tax=Clostridium oryzae TaxID=1450648 RepID=A0A1V4IQS4_9CLOT|nr:MDR family MFS transporter [Clostridium oryzae]OPJ62253.1 putative multidrug resistance protein EmrY [Clostridium oryzae]